MEIAVKIAQLIVSLSLLVICHEFGHFITAKIFKARVEKFYLFFDPWFSLFKTKRGETEYGIGWLPLGGYVKIAGMIDESMDTEQMNHEPQPWEFRSKPAWQRLIVMLAGVTVNVLLAMLIYAMMAFAWGNTYLPASNAKYGIEVDSVGRSLGLRDGDFIKQVNGKDCGDFNKIVIGLLLDSPHSMTLERGGADTTIVFSDEQIASILKCESSFFGPRFPFQVAEFPEDGQSPAKDAGIMEGDRFVMANGKPCQYFNEVRDFIQENKGKEAVFTVLRGADSVNVSLVVPEDGLIRVITKGPMDFLETEHVDYGFFESFPAGIKRGVDKIVEYCKQWKLIFNPKTQAYKSVGSFITMTKIFPGYWDWQSFWNITALFSIMLAVINVVPIPGLDGGHSLFTLVEIITGKQPSLKFLEYAQMVGMIFLILLMAFALGNDIFQLFN